MSKAEIINEEPNFEGVVSQTQEDQFFGKQTKKKKLLKILEQVLTSQKN